MKSPLHFRLGLFCLATTLLLINSAPSPQTRSPLLGAWEVVSSDEKLNPDVPDLTIVRIFSNGYTMQAVYDLANKRFEGASGGPYSYTDGALNETIDYDTWDAEQVGKQFTHKTELKDDNNLVFFRQQGDKTVQERWRRIDEGDSPLTGDWRIRERMGRDGEMRPMRPGPRKTIKILSGTRFQWAAMNTETKQFMGTGGGTYTFEGGKYTEQIEFFSRDSSRVGMSLSFDGKVEGDDWHHSGKSSKGNPIKEIWHRQ